MNNQKSSIFGRTIPNALPTVARGEGVFLYDTHGKRYLDACGGAAVSCLGHSNQQAIEAAKAQLDQIAYAHTSFFTSDPAESLANRLTDLAPPGLDRVYFVSGGSEAIEAAIKLARQYHLERGEETRSITIARQQSYHGNTLGALSAGGNEWRKAAFRPLLIPTMRHISPCHYWRFAHPHETPYDYGQRVASELETLILEEGPEKISAFIAEPIVGATMGAVPAVEGYFERIRKICDQYGVLLILDEVMCGMGRSGTLFAQEQENITADITCIAKGLGAGIQPIGAMLCSEEIYNTIAKGSGFFQHGHTYLAHATACAASLAVIEQVSDPNLLTQVRVQGEKLHSELDRALSSHPHVGDIRGRGLFLGIELVKDKSSKTPLDPALKTHKTIKQLAMEKGLMCYPMGGTIDGQNGDHILLAPPFIIEDSHIDQIVSTLTLCIEQAINTQ